MNKIPFIKLYVARIKEGKMKIEEVPSALQEEVKKLLEK